MIPSHGYATHSADAKLVPFSFERREPGNHDVVIKILYCGICHSDVHSARNDWGGAHYPMVPGHEIIGKVTRVGSAVKNVAVGDTAGVGCMVESCRTCDHCKQGIEQHCHGMTLKYNAPDKHTGGRTFGGYASNIVVDEAFVLKIDPRADLAATAPLLCAGITTYAPLKRWKAGPGRKVGVIGLGGLGHMAVKLARSFGAHVVLFTTSPNKKADALRLGAHEVVLSTDNDAMKARAGSLDLIIDTVSAPHDMNALLSLLGLDGTLVLVGLPAAPFSISPFTLIHGRPRLTGSVIGGIPETQEMLDYCAKHGIVSDIEIIPIQKVNEAYERMLKNDVKYRFVIDMSSLEE